MEEKVKNKKKSKITFKNITILTVIITTVILMGTLIIYKSKKDSNNVNYGFIDMTATENAKIENGVKENISENVAKEKTVGDLLLSDIKLKAEEGVSNLTANVKNNGSTDFVGSVAKIIFTNRDGSQYAELEVYLLPVKAGETNTMHVATDADIINAYDFTIQLQ